MLDIDLVIDECHFEKREMLDHVYLGAIKTDRYIVIDNLPYKLYWFDELKLSDKCNTNHYVFIEKNGKNCAVGILNTSSINLSFYYFTKYHNHKTLKTLKPHIRKYKPNEDVESLKTEIKELKKQFRELYNRFLEQEDQIQILTSYLKIK